MKIEGKNIGVAITGSFCTFDKVKKEISKLVDLGANVIPIFSFNAQSIDSRFCNAQEYLNSIKEITGNEPITTIAGAEPIGPKTMLDILILAPCTGNTMAKLCASITDTPALMAAKSHMRNERPIVISISTNDALGLNLRNIGTLVSTKNIYFVPFGQDDSKKKPRSMIAHVEMIPETVEAALDGIQIQPIIKSY